MVSKEQSYDIYIQIYIYPDGESTVTTRWGLLIFVISFDSKM